MTHSDDWWPDLYTGILGHGHDSGVIDRVKHAQVTPRQVAVTVISTMISLLEALRTDPLNDPEVTDLMRSWLEQQMPDWRVLEDTDVGSDFGTDRLVGSTDSSPGGVDGLSGEVQ